MRNNSKIFFFNINIYYKIIQIQILQNFEKEQNIFSF